MQALSAGPLALVGLPSRSETIGYETTELSDELLQLLDVLSGIEID